NEEGRQVARKFRARKPGAEGRRSSADLMARKNPAKHHSGALPSETVGGEFYRGRNGRDPVEAVEHRKQREAVEREARERQIEQRKSAQPVVPEQQPAIVVAVGQP